MVPKYLEGTTTFDSKLGLSLNFIRYQENSRVVILLISWSTNSVPYLSIKQPVNKSEIVFGRHTGSDPLLIE